MSHPLLTSAQAQADVGNVRESPPGGGGWLQANSPEGTLQLNGAGLVVYYNAGRLPRHTRHGAVRAPVGSGRVGGAYVDEKEERLMTVEGVRRRRR